MRRGARRAPYKGDQASCRVPCEHLFDRITVASRDAGEPTMNPASGDDDDHHDLAEFGYAPSLNRTLGTFSSFAAGFAFISILTGLFQMFYLGYGAAGPRFFWTWVVVAMGQMTVALCFAELAAHYPLCGSVYQWAARVGSPGLGWMAGWVSLAGTIVSLAAVSMALQAALPAISPIFQFVGDKRKSRRCRQEWRDPGLRTDRPDHDPERPRRGPPGEVQQRGRDGRDARRRGVDRPAFRPCQARPGRDLAGSGRRVRRSGEKPACSRCSWRR